MSTAYSTCGRCGKTVYAQEEVKAAGKIWHKACFRCKEASCGITLDLKSYLAYEGDVYCKNHVPKPKHTHISEDVATKHALNAPKKESETVGNVQKGGAKVFGTDFTKSLPDEVAPSE